MKIQGKLLIFTIMLLSLLSCSMKQEVYIEKSGSGTVNFEIVLAPYLTQVIDELTLLLDSGEGLPGAEEAFFDLPAIEEDFRNREGVELKRLENPERNRLTGEAAFTDISLLLQNVEDGTAESRMIQIKKIGDSTELIVQITRESVEALLKENPSINNPVMENFGPAATENLSSQEYLEMMEFALGEEGRRGIVESRLEIKVTVEGKILNQSGGQILDANTVNFSIPLLPFLMLNKPLQYSLLYQ